jgi:hypothetical protein
MLLTSLEDFITNKSTVEFFISCDYLKLRIDVDIFLLNKNTSYLSTYALGFF